jgi:hypothetical protein
MTSSRTDKIIDAKAGEDFFNRWSRRKQAALSDQQDATKVTTAAPVEDAQASMPTDADMAPIESLTEESDYSAFLSPKVSEALRKQALRKLFHGSAFNICDGLDDYDGDYTTFEKLGSIITADMKHHIELEARRRAQQLTESGSQKTCDETEVVAAVPAENDSDASAEILANTETEVSIDDDNDTEVKL